MTRLLINTTGFGLGVLLLMPLVVTPDTVFPHVVGKAVFARGVIDILAALWLALILWNPAYRPRPSPVPVAIGCYVIVALLSATMGASFNHSFWSDYSRMGGVWDWAHWGLLVLIVSSMVTTPKGWDRLFTWNLIVVAAVVTLGMLQSFGMAPLGLFLPQCRVDATLGNAGYLATILVVTTPLAAGLLARSFIAPPPGTETRRPGIAPGSRVGMRWSPRVVRAFYLSFIVMGLWVLLQTGTRGAFLGVVAGVASMGVALLIRGNREALRPTLVAGGGVLVLLALLSVLQLFSSPVLNRACASEGVIRRVLNTGDDDRSLTTRIETIRVGARAFADRPLLGWGPESFSVVYERFVDQPILGSRSDVFDKAHNQPVEELATKGMLGALSFAALWVMLLWGVIRRRRPARDEVFAYAVLGALVGYFVQNLFFFDTPSALLQWSLLAGWVAYDNRATRPDAGASNRYSVEDRPGRAEPRRSSSAMWAKGALTGTAATMAAMSIWFIEIPAYRSGAAYREVTQRSRSFEVQLEAAEDALGVFPPLSNHLRVSLFASIADAWPHLTAAEQSRALQLIRREAQAGLEAEPQNPELLTETVRLLQQAAVAPTDLEELEPLLARLEDVAPHRVDTLLRLAAQELLEGDYEGALSIADRAEASAPWVSSYFQEVRETVSGRSGLR